MRKKRNNNKTFHYFKIIVMIYLKMNFIKCLHFDIRTQMKTSEYNVWFVFVFINLFLCACQCAEHKREKIHFLPLCSLVSISLVRLFWSLVYFLSFSVFCIFICGTLFKLLNFLSLLKLMFVSFFPSTFFLLLGHV